MQMCSLSPSTPKGYCIEHGCAGQRLLTPWLRRTRWHEISSHYSGQQFKFYELLFLDPSIFWIVVCHKQLENKIIENRGAIGDNVCQSFHTLMLQSFSELIRHLGIGTMPLTSVFQCTQCMGLVIIKLMLSTLLSTIILLQVQHNQTAYFYFFNLNQI